jgi:hydrogenase-4 component H
MYLPKLREISEALRSLFSVPYTTKFPKAAYTPPEQFRGFPKYNEEKCVGCGACAQVCPTNAIEVIDDKENGVRRLIVDYNSCMHCGQCEEKCITGEGIKLSNMYSISVTDKKAPEVFESVEKELVFCEVCGEPIACKDHLYFIKDRLGAKAYAHPNLLLETQKEFTEPVLSKVKDRIRREDYIKEVCPKCRHKVVVADEF